MSRHLLQGTGRTVAVTAVAITVFPLSELLEA